MNIRRTFFMTLAVISLLGAGSCQKTYQMIPPPSASSSDDSLDDEDFGGNKETAIFVTPFGEGEMDGSSWENAFDADTFLGLLSDQTDLSKAKIYLSEGDYYMSSGSVFGPEIRKKIGAVMGGYSIMSKGTDVSARDVVNHATVFSGDVNKNSRADEGDCGLLCVYGGNSSFDGITFRNGYISEKTASAKKSGAGVFVDGDADTWVEFVNCRFENCVSAATTNGIAGGAAVYVISGQARLKDCELSGCSGVSRGGALRCNNDKAILFLDKCSVHGNSVRSDWGSGLQLSSGTICVNNSTFCSNAVGNNGAGGTVNGGGAMLVLNSTIISDDTTAGIRCESDARNGSFFANNISLNTNGAPGFLLNGNGRVAVSGGHNIFNKVAGELKSAASDVTYDTDLKNFGSLEDGAYIWNNAKVSLATYATASEIDGYAREFSPVICPVAEIGKVFAEWCDGFAVDGRGKARNPEKLLPGAYDPCLEGVAAKALRFNVSAVPFAGNSISRPDSFGFILTNPDGVYSYNKKMVLIGDEYVTDDGETMLWDGKGTTVIVTAYAPYAEVVDGVVPVSCPSNQATAAELTAADFVLWKGSVNPSTDLAGGKIQLNLGHLNARLIVKVTLNGVPVETSKIASLSVSGLKTEGKCDLSTDSPKVVADGAPVNMFPNVGKNSYELITVPQTVSAGSLSVKATFNKRQYVWAAPSDVTLIPGKTSELTINISTTKSAFSGQMSITTK